MSEPRSRPSFTIPQRPERRFSRSDGLSYEGTTVFVLTPDSVPEDVPDTDGWLYDRLEGVLDTDPYTYGDWFDLPMPVLLVHDRETGDVFRVAIRDGTVEFHVLPDTEPAGLAALYERLCGAAETESVEDDPAVGDETDTDPTGGSAGTWHVECRTDADR
jgi:hypothetical protein